MHESVMLPACMAHLQIRADGAYADLTYGRGGHSAAILAEMGSEGRLVVMDQDPQALDHARESYETDDRVGIVASNFRHADAAIRVWPGVDSFDGVLMDIGLSSPQLDEAGRGFSFLRDGELDMRMNPEAGVSAREWIARTPEAEMASVFREFGDERYPGRIARVICEARRKQAIRSTTELADLVVSAVPGRISGGKKIHPATRVFQAIRIVVNDELGALTSALDKMAVMIKPGGRLVVISFHSLEDRIVKRFMRDSADFSVVGKFRPDADEVRSNPRARSAMLRVAQRKEVAE